MLGVVDHCGVQVRGARWNQYGTVLWSDGERSNPSHRYTPMATSVVGPQQARRRTGQQLTDHSITRFALGTGSLSETSLPLPRQDPGDRAPNSHNPTNRRATL
jgi:hypothetical protein